MIQDHTNIGKCQFNKVDNSMLAHYIHDLTGLIDISWNLVFANIVLDVLFYSGIFCDFENFRQIVSIMLLPNP